MSFRKKWYQPKSNLRIIFCVENNRLGIINAINHFKNPKHGYAYVLCSAACIWHINTPGCFMPIPLTWLIHYNTICRKFTGINSCLNDGCLNCCINQGLLIWLHLQILVLLVLLVLVWMHENITAMVQHTGPSKDNLQGYFPGPDTKTRAKKFDCTWDRILH
jgi:hypothetical protein